MIYWSLPLEVRVQPWSGGDGGWRVRRMKGTSGGQIDVLFLDLHGGYTIVFGLWLFLKMYTFLYVGTWIKSVKMIFTYKEMVNSFKKNLIFQKTYLLWKVPSRVFVCFSVIVEGRGQQTILWASSGPLPIFV